MKVHTGADGTADVGNEALVGILWDTTWLSCSQARAALCAFSLCYPWNGAERPDTKLFWSKSGCIELSGAEPWRDTVAPGTHLHISSAALLGWGDPLPPSPGCFEPRGHCFPSNDVPSHCPQEELPGWAQHKWWWRGVKLHTPHWHSHLIWAGWSRDKRDTIPHSALSGRLLPWFKGLPVVVKPFSIYGTCQGTELQLHRAGGNEKSMHCKCWAKLHKTLIILHYTGLHCIHFNKPQSQTFPAVPCHAVEAIPIPVSDILISTIYLQNRSFILV